MSDETAQVLAKAEEALAEMTKIAERETEEFLAGVASEIPSRVDRVLKKAAQEQPEVTKALGREGLAKLRADLAAEAKKIADDLLQSGPSIDWPVPRGWGSSNTSDVASALTEHLQAGPLADIYHAAGYGSSGNYRRTEMHSSHLVDSSTPRYKQLVEVLRKLEDARSAVAEAKKADDAAIVADLWGE